MEALVTLLFFVVLWGAAKGLKVLGRDNPDLRALSDALSRGENVDKRPPHPTPHPAPHPAPEPTPEAQQPTTTKPAP